MSSYVPALRSRNRDDEVFGRRNEEREVPSLCRICPFPGLPPAFLPPIAITRAFWLRRVAAASWSIAGNRMLPKNRRVYAGDFPSALQWYRGKHHVRTHQTACQEAATA